MVKQKVAVLYGIGEGDYHGRAFVRSLKHAGFDIVRDARKADVVVTHSGGCFFLPPPDLNQKFILINPPYWPDKSLLISMIQKVWRDYNDFARDGLVLQWLWKTAVNVVHLIRYAIKSVLIITKAQKQRFYEAVRDEYTVIIRSDYDSFLAPNADQLLEQKVGRSIPFYHTRDQHDGCWRNPAPYVTIIREIAHRGR